LGIKPPSKSSLETFLGASPLIKSLKRMEQAENGRRVVSPEKKGDSVEMVAKYRRKNAGLLPGVKAIFDKKRRIVDDIAKGVRVPTNKEFPSLLALFSRDEIKALFGLSRARKQAISKQAFFDEVLAKTTKGVLSPLDVERVAKEFGENSAAKMTILYNDRLFAEKKSKGFLAEKPPVKKLRKQINELRAWADETHNLIDLLNRINTQKYKTANDFINAVNSMGPHARYWFDKIDWRYRPHLIQFAVGNNQMIPNPTSGEKYCYNWVKDWKSWEQHSSYSARGLKETIPNIRGAIKAAFVERS